MASDPFPPLPYLSQRVVNKQVIGSTVSLSFLIDSIIQFKIDDKPRCVVDSAVSLSYPHVFVSALLESPENHYFPDGSLSPSRRVAFDPLPLPADSLSRMIPTV